MTFDWSDVNFDLKNVKKGEIAESFEDPFAIRLLPDEDDPDAETRFFLLGKTVNERGLFSVFWTDGKNYRVILSREMTDSELNFYDRKTAENF
jgi:uncharacterized DUF497 family protein